MDNEHLSIMGIFSKLQHFKVFSGFKPTLNDNKVRFIYKNYNLKSKLIHIVKYCDFTDKEQIELIKIIEESNDNKFNHFMKKVEDTLDVSDSERIYWLIFNGIID